MVASRLAMTIFRALSFVPSEIRLLNGENGPNQVKPPGAGGNSRNSRATNGFDWKTAVLDAAIVAGLNFFSTLSALGYLNVSRDPLKALVAACISAGLGFFTTLALKRGLLSSVYRSGGAS